MFILNKFYLTFKNEAFSDFQLLPLLLRPWLARTFTSIVNFLGISISRSVRSSTFTTLASTISTLYSGRRYDLPFLFFEGRASNRFYREEANIWGKRNTTKALKMSNVRCISEEFTRN